MAAKTKMAFTAELQEKEADFHERQNGFRHQMQDLQTQMSDVKDALTLDAKKMMAVRTKLQESIKDAE